MQTCEFLRTRIAQAAATLARSTHHDQAIIDEINKLLEGVQEGFELKK